MSKGEVYVSTDIEADGPIPGPHSMLSMASAAFAEGGSPLGTFTANLDELPGAAGAPRTMEWWKTQPAAWEACRTGARPPADVMRDYVAWLQTLPGRPVFVAYPAGFDFTFVYWYLVRFTGDSPFSHSALDMKTLAMALLGLPYRDATKRAFPPRWRSNRRHSHVALDDAIEQGEIFVKMLAELRGNRVGPHHQ